jgi:hypothetical protein
MKYLLALTILASCSHQPAFEMEELSKDVLGSKTHEGIDIRITPIEQEKK